MKPVSSFCSIFLLTLIFSCGNKNSSFTADELRFFNAYKKGDIIYFENSKGEMDTFTVEAFRALPVGRSGNDDTCILIRHLPLDTFHDTLWRPLDNARFVEYQPLIQLHKSHDGTGQGDIYYTFHFRDFKLDYCDYALGFLHTDTLQVNRLRFTNYYKIHHIPLTDAATGIEYLYWTEKYGLTAYTTWDGQTWSYARKDPAAPADH